MNYLASLEAKNYPYDFVQVRHCLGDNGAPDVIVSAFKPSDDGKALIVRLFGAGGRAERVTLQWSEPGPKRVAFSDNSERAGERAGKDIDVPAFGIVTLRAELPK
jgi:alpha-mannosidase